MGVFDFLKGKSKSKPSEIMRRLAAELKDLKPATSAEGSPLSVSDEECNELETYLAASCAGVTANVYIKKQPKPEEIDKCLCVAQQTDLMIHVSHTIAQLAPETRRIVCAIWGYLLKMEDPKSFQRPMVEYLIKHTQAVDALIKAYGKNSGRADVTIGVMIRDAMRFTKIVEYICKNCLVFSFFPVLSSANFDVSSDAFQTLKEVLTNHKDVSAPWLSKNFDRFFSEYMNLLKDGVNADYVIVRQSLAILSGVLLDRQFMDTMIQFVNRDAYLKPILVLLGNQSKVVQFEAFHIFKIFAANPNKPLKVSKILNQNHERIIKLLNQIEQDRLDDNEFRQDKNAVVAKLEALEKKIKVEPKQPA